MSVEQMENLLLGAIVGLGIAAISWRMGRTPRNTTFGIASGVVLATLVLIGFAELALWLAVEIVLFDVGLRLWRRVRERLS